MTAAASRPRSAPGERPPRRPTAADGLVVVDKPAGWTSHDVVARMRRVAGTRKVGHAGTLDPMATGVLVLGIGRATRLLTYVVGADKEYVATIRLGVATTTDDAEGELLTAADASAVTRAAIDAGVAVLTGPIEQVPSSVSAIKVDGQRAYARVRNGEQVELAARPVTISRFEVHEVRPVSLPGDAMPAGAMPDGEIVVLDVDVTVVCSSGTYIRALARDLGTALGVGGHLTALRRTRVGGYGLAGSRTLDELKNLPADMPLDVLSLADAARATFVVRDLTPEEAAALSYGKRIDVGEQPVGETVAAIAPDGTLVALLEASGPHARPVLVFAPA
ncbi:tRNA pseudouridine(55) synthase TruB [Pengzhenrongella frigida]|uniref:tRNA pseudouridine synthase B n=1 Tax=Pengzhenrongella frigida TaxID=1259133 RepID=A0A4V1ZHL1_9MICO|nr:tRNA pseudouridine(55) synthase TruB [Cellulomonas sp. HLT2-17]RYV52424.1 tRNA pseudouridine(55) synthase TruB [Cellulomonas sp. HLT2-17]